MSLLRKLRERMIPRVGEFVAIYQDGRLLAEGTVVAADQRTITIAGKNGLIDLDTTTLRRGLGDGSIIVQREDTDSHDDYSIFFEDGFDIASNDNEF